MIFPERIIEENRAFANGQQDTDALHNHTCQCGRGLKMPHSDLCVQCYRTSNYARLKDQRRTYLEKQQAKKRKGRDKKITHKIKGLDKIKLG